MITGQRDVPEGKIIVNPPRTTFVRRTNITPANVALYGATGARGLYLRHAGGCGLSVSNSGVNERFRGGGGVIRLRVHAGGRVVVIARRGGIAAGMSGGEEA